MNVVAFDYFMGTNVVDIAVYTNRYKIFNQRTSSSSSGVSDLELL